MSELRSCDVAIVGAGLSGLRAAHLLDRDGVEVLVLEAQDRVGGRTLTAHLEDSAFIDDGGQWVSPNQGRIVALASELNVELFPSWAQGKMVLIRNGTRHVSDGLFLPEDGHAAGEATAAAEDLATMAESVSVDAPWRAEHASKWDTQRLHEWRRADRSSSRTRRDAPSRPARSSLVVRWDSSNQGLASPIEDWSHGA